MSTITDKGIIKNLLKNAGRYEDDPPVLLVYKYEHADHPEKEHFAVFWSHKDDDMATSPYVRNFSMLQAAGALTPEGIRWLREQEGR